MVPIVPYQRLKRDHATLTPDAAHPINRFPVSLSQQKSELLVLTSFDFLTMLQMVVHFHSSSLSTPAMFDMTFDSLLTTAAFDRSSVSWFRTCPYRPTLRDLPSSLIELQITVFSFSVKLWRT